MLHRSEKLARRLRGWRRERMTAGQELLSTLGRLQEDVFFIEVGANDGTHLDHLRPFIRSRSWRGIMVEPVPYVFERLRRNCGGVDGITLENVAIADRNGWLPFYHVVEATDHERQTLPLWYDQIGSFSREVVASHVSEIADIERRIVRTDVECLTFESLCARNAVRNIDLLVIDTEGYDHEIVKNIDFALRRPRLLVYEHFHLSAEARSACRRRLVELGYQTLEEGFDTWCLDCSHVDRLTRMWAGLRPAVPAVVAEHTVSGG